MPNEPDALSQASTAALELYHDLRKAQRFAGIVSVDV